MEPPSGNRSEPLPLGCFPELPPPDDFVFTPPPRQELQIRNDTILEIGTGLSRVGVNIADVLTELQLKTYIAIAENPTGTNSELSKRWDILPTSFRQTRPRLLSRLCEICEAGIDDGFQQFIATGAARPSEPLNLRNPPRMPASNENILDFSRRLTDAGVSLERLLTPAMFKTYQAILAQPDMSDSDLGEQRELAPNSVINTRRRLLTELRGAYDAYEVHKESGGEVETFLQTLHRTPPVYSQLIEKGQSYEVVRRHGTTIDAVRAMARIFEENEIKTKGLLPARLAMWFSTIAGSEDNGTELARTAGVSESAITHMCKRIITRLSPHIPSGIELPPILAPPGTIGTEIGKHILEHAIRELAARTEIGHTALASFIQGNVSLPPEAIEAILNDLELPEEQVADLRRRYRTAFIADTT